MATAMTSFGDVQPMVGAALKDYNAAQLQLRFDSTVNKNAQHLYRNDHKKNLAGSYPELYHFLE